MLLGGDGVDVVVVVRDQLFFCQVLHVVGLTNGSSASRNLRTARKIVCFAALTWIAQGLADLFDRHAFEMAENECRPLVAAEQLHGRGDVLLQIGRQKQAILLRLGSSRAGQLGRFGIAAVVTVSAAAGTEQIERTVDGDAVQPGAEVRALLEVLELAVGAKERLLHHVVGIMFISGHAIRHSKCGPGVPLDQLPERIGVAGSGPARLRQGRSLSPSRKA